MEHSGCCAGTAAYYRITEEAVLVRQSTIGALERMSWYSRVLQDHLTGCFGTLLN